MRNAIVLLLTALCLSITTGCSWMGRTAGKAQAKVERKVDAVEQGYHDGYEQERNKNGQQKQSPDQQEQPRE